MQGSKSDSYAKAGVDVTAGYDAVKRMKPHIESTYRPGVIGTFGGFGGFFDPSFHDMKRPIFVSGTDGVGTKLKIAQIMDKHDTVGIDCVAMCVNDIICSGAEPLFFLDYIATGKNIPVRMEYLVSGIADGCRQAGCALIGGETAEHPGMMQENEYDIAGFCVGVVDYDNIIDGKLVGDGDVIIGLGSTGLHSNGFSLVRSIFDTEMQNLSEYYTDLGCTLGEELLRPTKIYVKQLLTVIRAFPGDIKGICNITGGGLYENIPRVLPEGIRASVNATKFPQMPIFSLVAKKGNIPIRDLYNTFNMGIGVVIIVSETKVDSVMATLREQGEKPIDIGVCESGDKGLDLTW